MVQLAVASPAVIVLGVKYGVSQTETFQFRG
jgi:hypothetical protein